MKRETIRTNQNLPRNHQESTIIKQSWCLPGRFWSVPFSNVMNKVSISQIILIIFQESTSNQSEPTRNQPEHAIMVDPWRVSAEF